MFNYLPDELLYKVMYMLNYEDLEYFCKTEFELEIYVKILYFGEIK